jgi:hypothetical protein
MRRLVGVAVLVVVAIVGVAATALGEPSRGPAAHAAKRETPRLGRKWAPYQTGYGRVRPHKIFNGGDPTGVVTHIHWTRWGKKRAIGRGHAEYVWPGTTVAGNDGNARAKVVAFHLGRCRGHRSYNAISWFFPDYDETFDPRSYINICTGRYHLPPTPPLLECDDVELTDGSGWATYVYAQGLSCDDAEAFVAGLPVADYFYSGGRWVTPDGYRCGTEGYNPEFSDSANFGCAKGDVYVGFDVS